MVKKILVIGHSNIGDVCYDLVVIKPLLQHFPHAKISFLTSPRAENIVRGYEGIASIFTFDRRKGFGGRLRLMGTLIKERFDLVVALKSTLMYRFLGIPRLWSVRKYLGCSFAEKRMHVVDIYLDFLRAQGINVTEAVFGFQPEEKEFCDSFFAEHGIQANDTLVGILPLSAWSLKSWPPEKWTSLAKKLKKEYGVKVIAFGKRSDFEKCPAIARELAPEVVVADQTTLSQALALIKRCALFIGPDSGFLHLASCMGVASIGVYGPTPKDYIVPYFHRNNIVGPATKLECMPCYPDLQACVCSGKLEYGTCMENIQVEDVAEMVASLHILRS